MPSLGVTSITTRIRVAINKNCPGERAIMTHEVIYPLTIAYGPSQGKGIPHCPNIEEGNITKNKITNR